MKKLNRREFFGCGAKGLVAAGAAGALAGCPAPTVPPVVHATQLAQVAAVRGLDLAQMARDAIDAIGGIGQFIAAGDRVFIKPNFGSVGLVHHDPILSGECTKIEILVAVAEECLKAGAAEVIAGDAAQVARFDWESLHSLDGSVTLADEVARLNAAYGDRFKIACLTADSPGWADVPSYTALGTIRISSLITRADKVISLPVIKTHRWTQITGALKNFVGATSTCNYGAGSIWRFALHEAGIEQAFLDIVTAVKPVLTVVDGSVVCEGNGPHVLPGWWGTTVDLRERLGDWFVIASNDLVAADATAAYIIGQEPTKVAHLNMAYNQGLGQLYTSKMQFHGESIENLRVALAPAEPTNGFSDILLPGVMMLLEPRH